jgi:SAM-dependent methyltransferase
MPALEAITYLYFGNLFPGEAQFGSGQFHGLALNPRFQRDIPHDAAMPLPFPDASIKGFQSQDVFEHIEYGKVPPILDEIFRCLRPGGLFRLSLPDYNSPLLRNRSVYDSDGNILCDLSMGGSVSSRLNEEVKVSFAGGGEAHLWFPTYANVLQLVLSSRLRKCDAITVHHAWYDRRSFVCQPFDGGVMPVRRAPPNDMRAQGRPVSLIIDFVK